jgi:DNA-binding CsgD family transcriptional regulator
MKKRSALLIVCFLVTTASWAQYEFTGNVNQEYIDGTIYLSLVEDYRKISGVHPEQILNKTKADTTGFFRFNGNNLSGTNKIYRIHIDSCTEEEQQTSHFTGHCKNSKEIVFVANNSTSLSLPFGFEREMFCSIRSKNEKASAFLKIDSLKNDMKYAFGTYRSEANRKLNSKKWFSILQLYGEQLNEPLAELYSYAFLSDRSSNLHGYYLEDLKTNTYYSQLQKRLVEKYPNSPYIEQYNAELTADRVLVSNTKEDALPWWSYLLGALALVSFFGNIYLYHKNKSLQTTFQKNQLLSKQERRILELIRQDRSNKEIANELFVSVSTVKTHINNLYKKLGISSREAAKNL